MNGPRLMPDSSAELKTQLTTVIMMPTQKSSLLASRARYCILMFPSMVVCGQSLVIQYYNRTKRLAAIEISKVEVWSDRALRPS
jgi:hypothetical protein